jgi:hypothetical protein
MRFVGSSAARRPGHQRVKLADVLHPRAEPRLAKRPQLGEGERGAARSDEMFHGRRTAAGENIIVFVMSDSFQSGSVSNPITQRAWIASAP